MLRLMESTKIILVILVISSEAVKISLSVNIPEENGEEPDVPVKTTGRKYKRNAEAENTTAVVSKFEGLNCDVDSLDGIFDSLRSLMEDPEKVVSPPEYICTVLLLLKRTQENQAEVAAMKESQLATESQLEIFNISITSHDSAIEELLETSENNFQEESVVSLSSLQNQFNNFATEFLRSLEKQTDIVAMVSTNIREVHYLNEALNDTSSLLRATIIGADKTFTMMEDKLNATTSNMTQSLEELKSRTSKTEVEMVERISSVIQDLKTLEKNSESALKGEMDRALQKEMELNLLLEEESMKVISALEMFTAKLTDNMKLIKNEQMDLFLQNVTESVESKISEVHKSINEFKADFGKKLEDRVGGKNGTEITDGIRELVDSQFKLLETLKHEVKSQVDAEASRASKAESKLLETIHNESAKSLKEIEHVKGKVEKELERTEARLEKIHEGLKSQEEQYKSLEDEFSEELSMESRRAKSSEDQMTSKITQEIERAKEAENNLVREIKSIQDKVLGELRSEIERAKDAEDSITSKVTQETERASSAETNLLSNINEELKRASEKEQLLQEFEQTNAEGLKTLEERLDSRLNAALNKSSTAVESKLSLFQRKFELVQESFPFVVERERLRAMEIERELNESMKVVETKAEKLEHTILTALKTEAQRLEEFQEDITLELSAEILRAHNAERELYGYQVGNWSNIDSKIMNAFGKINNQTVTQIESRVKDTTEFLLGKISTLSTSVDNRMTNVIKEGDEKLKKLDEELKKCCSSSGWFSRRPTFFSSAPTANSTAPGTSTTAGGVLDRVMGLFGRRRVTAATNGTIVSAKIAGIKSSVEDIKGRYLSLKSAALSNPFNTSPVKGSDGAEKLQRTPSNSTAVEDVAAHLLSPLEDPKESSEVVGNSGVPVIFHRFNSKVRNTYG